MRKKKGPDIASMSGPLGGAVDETRTRDLHLGKVALYQLSYYRMRFGAGDGNRTHVASLEGWNSTIELHPQIGAVDETRTRDLHLGKVALYQLSYYRKAKYIIAHFAPEGKP